MLRIDGSIKILLCRKKFEQAEGLPRLGENPLCVR